MTLQNGILVVDLFRIAWALLSIACGFTSVYVFYYLLVAIKEKRIGREDFLPFAGTVILVGCSGWFSTIVWVEKVMK